MPQTLDPAVARSWLLIPGNKPDRFADAVSSRTDAVIIDLEDACPANEKAESREAVVEWLSAGNRAWVRINDAASDFWNEDCRALADAEGLQGIMLAKTESETHILDTASRLPEDTRILTLVETARGLQNVQQIAEARPTFRIAFGSGDFRRDTGASGTEMALLFARSSIVVASRAARLPSPIDGPTLDRDQVFAATKHARELGMGGKLHPASEPAGTINEAFNPDPDEIRWALAFLERFEADGGQVQDGSDLPRLARARRTVELAKSFKINLDRLRENLHEVELY